MMVKDGLLVVKRFRIADFGLCGNRRWWTIDRLARYALIMENEIEASDQADTARSPVRDHSAFLDSYAPEDEGLYDYCSTG